MCANAFLHRAFANLFIWCQFLCTPAQTQGENKKGGKWRAKNKEQNKRNHLVLIQRQRRNYTKPPPHHPPVPGTVCVSGSNQNLTFVFRIWEKSGQRHSMGINPIIHSRNLPKSSLLWAFSEFPWTNSCKQRTIYQWPTIWLYLSIDVSSCSWLQIRGKLIK